MPHALIVDDDVASVMLLSRLLEHRGFTTRSAGSLAEARESLDPYPDSCLVDVKLPDGDGTSLLDEGLGDNTDFILITGEPSVESSVEALRRGARDYLTKPIDRVKLERALARFIAPAARPAATSTSLIGESPEMLRLARTINRVGPTDVTVLIVGESGTGKELIANRLHALSARAKGPYLALNCGAVSPNLIESELFGHERGSFTGATRQHAGYFERAHGGTLFLDEITEMPLDLQVRLLRVLETREVARVGSSESVPVNVRVIAATNRDPREAVRQGRLREDLLYRLQVVPIEVPPLRQRAGDVRLLALHFLAQLNQGVASPKSFSDAALARLEGYPWPGNVRELYNLVQRAFVLTEGNVITHPHVQQHAPQDAGVGPGHSIQVRMGETLAKVEQRVILHTLRNCRTQEEAARLLGVSTKTLYNKLRLYGRSARERTASGLPSLEGDSVWGTE
ncbi:MAG TPA: sigma-54 dependent transcriptional regulator [Casimicrobiaceae bacterium]|nr:sigma-54 dependent transcriptional regulator [Casimicrobiaceae bacterium]